MDHMVLRAKEDLESTWMSEDELVERSQGAGELYGAGKLLRVKSVADFLE